LRGGLAALVAVGLVALAGVARSKLEGDTARADKARALSLELSTKEAGEALAGADPSDPLLAIERARVALYEGRCVEAAGLVRPEWISGDPALAALVGAARGCEQSMAAAVVLEDPERGAWVRFQDEADRVLAPRIADTVARSRELFARELGVTLPVPVRVELVRDQRALAAMTGLPLAAARTTGTIGIAKWGRVIVVSPRATPKGYAYLDTLSHELAHLALTRGSADRAPLWLQEGVARSLETRWREPSPFDRLPPADALAGFGLERGIGPDIDKIGPSIALLPSAEEAQITYAKVESFIEFFGREAGEKAMVRLLEELKRSTSNDDVAGAVERVSGATFASWAERWREATKPRAAALAERDRPGAPAEPGLKEGRKRLRLAQLLLDREHDRAAGIELHAGREALPRSAIVRALAAAVARRTETAEKARALVEKPEDVDGAEGRWWSVRAALAAGDAERERDRTRAEALTPYDPAVACEERGAPELPVDPARAALCKAARERPRAR
jgi:hypothetical protein